MESPGAEVLDEEKGGGGEALIENSMQQESRGWWGVAVPQTLSPREPQVNFYRVCVAQLFSKGQATPL